MEPKFPAQKSLNFNLSFSMSSLPNQLPEHIKISTLPFFSPLFNLLGQHLFRSNRPQMKQLPQSTFYFSSSTIWSLFPPCHRMSLAKITNNLRIDKSSCVFSHCILFDISDTAEQSLYLDLTIDAILVSFLTFWQYLGLLYKFFLILSPQPELLVFSRV